MAVTNNATLIEDHETAPTYTSVGGGQGAGAETNFYFLGIQASSRKMSGVTKNGFFFNPGATTDLSAAGTHVKMYINAITQASFTDFWIRIGDSTTTYEEHNVGVGFYDNSAGGWIPVWVEVDAGTDTGTPDFTIADEFCVLCTMGSISGNVKNWCTDQLHSATRPALLWDGLTGDLDDFITTEDAAGVGALKLLNGLYTCYANLKIGSATSTSFDMAGKTVAFPDATWLPAASTWMGLDFDLAHASTDIDATTGSIISGNPGGATARKPDIIVTGTAGALDFSGRAFDGLRIMTLTSGVTMNNASIANSGVITLGGATAAGCSVSAGTGTEAVATDDLDLLDGWSFTSAGTGYAVDLGTVSSSVTMGWNCTTSGYAATDGSTGDETILVDIASPNVLTINSSGTKPTIHKTGTGTVTVLEAQITIAVTVLDDDTGSAIGTTARVLLYDKSDYSTEILNAACSAGGVASTTQSYVSDIEVEGWAREMSLTGTDYTPLDISGTVTSTGFTFTARLKPID